MNNLDLDEVDQVLISVNTEDEERLLRRTQDYADDQTPYECGVSTQNRDMTR